VDATRPWRKSTTKECLKKRSGERNVDAGLQVKWRKMEGAAQDRAL